MWYCLWYDARSPKTNQILEVLLSATCTCTFAWALLGHAAVRRTQLLTCAPMTEPATSCSRLPPSAIGGGVARSSGLHSVDTSPLLLATGCRSKAFADDPNEFSWFLGARVCRPSSASSATQKLGR